MKKTAKKCKACGRKTENLIVSSNLFEPEPYHERCAELMMLWGVLKKDEVMTIHRPTRHK